MCCVYSLSSFRSEIAVERAHGTKRRMTRRQGKKREKYDGTTDQRVARADRTDVPWPRYRITLGMTRSRKLVFDILNDWSRTAHSKAMHAHRYNKTELSYTLRHKFESWIWIRRRNYSCTWKIAKKEKKNVLSCSNKSEKLQRKRMLQ